MIGKREVMFAVIVAIVVAGLGETVFTNRQKWFDFYTDEVETSFGTQIVEARIDSPALIISVNFTEFHYYIDKLNPDVIYKNEVRLGWYEGYYVFNEDMTIAYEYIMRMTRAPNPWGKYGRT